MLLAQHRVKGGELVYELGDENLINYPSKLGACINYYG
jgi:hypothetical protein